MTVAPVDLFGWENLKTAHAAIQQAYADQSTAYRRVRTAPHGTRRDREQALKAAMTARLQAELAYAAALREADQ